MERITEEDTPPSSAIDISTSTASHLAQLNSPSYTSAVQTSPTDTERMSSMTAPHRDTYKGIRKPSDV